jgi:hypothetical protein
MGRPGGGSKMRRLSLFFVLVSLISSTVFAHPPKIYRSKDGAFEIELPEGWNVDDSGMNGTLAVFLGPPRGQYSAAFVSVNIWKTGDASLQERITSTREKFSQAPFSIVSERELRVGSEPGYEFTTRSDAPAAAKLVVVHFEKKEYSFLYMAMDNAAYADFEPVFQGLLRSVRWIKTDRTYRSPDGAFSLKVPDRWLVVKLDEEVTDRFVLLGPEWRGYSVVIHVTSYDQKGEPLERFVERRIAKSDKKQSMRMMTLDDRRYLLFDEIGNPASRGNRTLANKKALELTFNLDGFPIYVPDDDPDPFKVPALKDDTRDVRVLQVITSHRGRVYIFSLNTFKDLLAQHRALLDEVLGSLEWY